MYDEDHKHKKDFAIDDGHYPVTSTTTSTYGGYHAKVYPSTYKPKPKETVESKEEVQRVLSDSIKKDLSEQIEKYLEDFSENEPVDGYCAGWSDALNLILGFLELSEKTDEETEDPETEFISIPLEEI